MSRPEQCSIHTHSVRCDGKHTMAEMAAAAFAAGVRYFGFSGHSHSPFPLDQELTLAEDTTAYWAEALALRAQYAGRMEVLCGLEWDSCSDGPDSGWDYWIGSVHHMPVGDATYPVDWEIEKLLACRDEVCGGDSYAVAEAYFRQVAAVAAKKPTILGHLDLICKFNAAGALLDEDHPRYRAAALAALRQADPAVTLLEINTGAISRGYRTTPYPAPFLLEEWRRMGGRVILTADAHSTDHILFGYDLAAQAARAAGFAESWLLTAAGLRPAAL